MSLFSGDELAKISAIVEEYQGKSCLRLTFPYDTDLIAKIKEIPGRQWSVQKRCWYVPDVSKWREIFGIRLDLIEEPSGLIVGRSGDADHTIQNLTSFEKLPEETRQRLNAFRQWMEQHRYSDQTIRNYLNHLSQFFLFVRNLDLKAIKAEDVILFNHEMIIKGKLSVSYQRVMTGAIKLFYSHFFDHAMDVDELDRPFREKTLPVVLSKQEVERILKNAGNIKHRAMLSLMYSCGLRRGELLSLKITDLDLPREIIFKF